MFRSRTVIQLARVPLLAAVLVTSAWPHQDFLTAVMRLQGYLGEWLLLTMLWCIFVAVMLSYRTRHQPAVVLALEGVVATVFALMPPSPWLLRTAMDSTVGQSVTAGPIQALALAWLGVVIATAVRQRRGAGSVHTGGEPSATHDPEFAARHG